MTGIVQGVGFRPFVFRLAQELGLPGYVLNDDSGVTIEIECSQENLECFLHELRTCAPAAARIESVSHAEVEFYGYCGFEIRSSQSPPSGTPGRSRSAGVSPDLAICPDCRAEIQDATNRRYAYPLTNCTNCGPRYTIIREVPYDRAGTTMARFQMCPECDAEYRDPENRRFHAQPNACPACGPTVQLFDSSGKQVKLPLGFHRDKPVLDRCVAYLRQGKILALKGIGGFHLACDASNEAAVQKLRQRKSRERKPFAVMFPSLESLVQHAEVSEAEASILASPASPIVLVRKRKDMNALAEAVAPQESRLGAFLAYSPLHELLLNTFGRPLVMTSGNVSDEPIVHLNEDALKALAPMADYLLLHDREIEVSCDDSVVQEFRARPFFFRRSRGYVPLGIRIAEPLTTDLLAVGAGLKNTVTLGKAGRSELFVSQHIGDLDTLGSMEFFEATISHLSRLFDVQPKFIAHDLHLNLPSAAWALEQARLSGTTAIPVQHHHAHIASCLESVRGTADGNGNKAVIGVALDGTGLGPDGTIWGGEFLIADRRDFLKVGGFRRVSIAGGDFAVRQPWRAALAYLEATGFPVGAQDSFFSEIPAESLSVVHEALSKNLNCFTTSSCGRLFDAISAIAGLCHESTFEGEAAIRLEAVLSQTALVEGVVCEAPPVNESGGELELDWRPLVRQAADDRRAGIPAAEISARFHCSMVAGLVTAVQVLGKRFGISTVALSGGCFLNTFLREQLVSRLEDSRFDVLWSDQVPCNDGGISFGQAIVANQIIKGAQSCVWQYR